MARQGHYYISSEEIEVVSLARASYIILDITGAYLYRIVNSMRINVQRLRGEYRRYI